MIVCGVFVVLSFFCWYCAVLDCVFSMMPVVCIMCVLFVCVFVFVMRCVVYWVVGIVCL